MTYRVLYRPEAVEDVKAAYQWYEIERPGLGTDFRDALSQAERLLAQSPEAFPVVYRDLRRLLLHRFPYSVYFLLGQDEVEIRGCIHHSRHPRNWRSRGRTV